MQEQEPSNKPIIKEALLPNGWPPRRKVAVVAVRIIAALAMLAVFMIVATYVCDCGLTRWKWLRLLIVPATIAGVGIWFNWAQQKREAVRKAEQAEEESREARIREAIQNAVQGEKETVAYVAYKVEKEGLKNVLQETAAKDRMRRGEMLESLCLSYLFEASDRTRAMILAALERSLKNEDLHREENKKVIEETLCRLYEAISDYEIKLVHSAKSHNIDVNKLKIGVEEHRLKLKALQGVLGLIQHSSSN
jgi:hypothetical protein